MSWEGLRGRVREFFTLEEMGRTSHALPEEERAAASHALALAMQRCEAAETLWPRGSTAEALGLVYASIHALSSALTDLESKTVGAPSPWLSSSLAILAEAQKETTGATGPELDADVRPDQEAAFPRLVDALVRAKEAIGPKVAGPAEVAALRRARRFGGALGATVVAIGAVAALEYALYKPPFSRAVASAALTEHVAARAIDGDTNTWWVLPTKDPGWIDLTLGKARPVPRLRIVGHNPPWNDHVAKDAHVEAFLNGTFVKATDVSFRVPPSSEPDWTEVKLGATKCDRIRITLQGALKNTAAIGEVELP